MPPELKASLEAALQAATTAGDMDTVHAIAGILKKAAPSSAAASADSPPITPTVIPPTPASTTPPLPDTEHDRKPVIDTQTTAATPVEGDPTQTPPADDVDPAPGPLYTSAQTQLETMYPGHEFEDELPDAVVISSIGDDGMLDYWEIGVTIAADGTATLATPIEVQPPAGDAPNDFTPPTMDAKKPMQYKARAITLEMTGATPPTEYRLWAFGTVSTTKGDFEFTAADAKNVMTEYAAHGVELHFDYEHGTFDGTPAQPAPAAAWMSIELRDDGLWLTNIRWTARAAQMLADKEYRYLSPAFEVDDAGHISKLMNVALTNLPATRNLAPLVTAKEKQLEAVVQTKDAEIAALKREAFTVKLGAKLKSLEDAGVPPAVMRLVRPVLAADETALSITLASGSSGRPGDMLTAALLEMAKLGSVPRGEITKEAAHQSLADLEITLTKAADQMQAQKPGMRRSDAIIAARKQYPHLREN